MLRIAHISDLHIEDGQVRKDHQSLFQWLEKLLGRDFLKNKIDLKGHNEDKLDALKNIFKWLKPNVIMVTGDLTNFGDENSLKLAKDILKELQQIAEAKHIICVPGNHDTFIERINYLKNNIRMKLHSWPIFRSVLGHKGNILEDVKEKLSKKYEDSDRFCFLDNYKKIIEPIFGKVDPRNPTILGSIWGNVMIFSFNSSNDSLLMANEGLIGPKQFNSFNYCIQDFKNKDLFTQAFRIAILHHHPISAPGVCASALERGFNWMQDGPRFLDYMNYCNFHFVLHGHEHSPFLCNINYENRPGNELYILAAGSALQGDNPDQGSFNIIDLRTPFEAKFARYDYRATGFAKDPQSNILLQMRPLSLFRVSPTSGRETSEDLAVRDLFQIHEEAYDENHRYDLLDFKVVIEKNQLYKGVYRRKGMVVGEEPDKGLVFVITGSPKMNWEDMHIKATNNKNSSELSYELLLDTPFKKVIQVLHRLQLAPNEEFDIILSFQWQATEYEPNNFDGMNLMYFRHPVGEMRYQVNLPWIPAQPNISVYGPEKRTPKIAEEKLVEENGGQQYLVVIVEPEALPYLVRFEPRRQ